MTSNEKRLMEQSLKLWFIYNAHAAGSFQQDKYCHKGNIHFPQPASQPASA